MAVRSLLSHYSRTGSPAPLLPILAALFFVAIVFGWPPEAARAQPRSNSSRTSMRTASPSAVEDSAALPSKAGAAARGEVALRCLPSVDFAAKHVAQVLAFLIRNRGKLDTDVVREKWKHLDRFSLPLAIYLRDMEAGGEWAALENEIAASPPPLRRASFSNKHGEILKLIAAWERRARNCLN